jgi:hypothetical protein
MSYLGRGVDKISNIETLDNITFNGASSYTLQKGGVNFVPTSAAAILISIDGVVQSGNFTVSSSTIDFGTAVAGTSTCNFIIHLGSGVLTAPSDGSVSTAKIADDAVTEAKLNLISTSSVPSLEAKGDGSSQDGYIQLNCSQNSHGIKLKSPPHSAGQSYTLTFPQSISADTFLKTDGSGNLSFASAGETNTPYFQVSRQSSYHAVSATTDTTVQFNQVDLDTGSDWNSGTYKWTPEAGKYFLNSRLTVDAGTIQGNFYIIYIRKNTTLLSQQIYRAYYNASFTLETSCIATANGSDTFDVQVYLQTAENIGYGARQSFFEGFKISST